MYGYIRQFASSNLAMKPTDLPSENLKAKAADVYIDFLSRTLGASREEILEVAKRSGVSTRRIAEYLVKQKKKAAGISTED